MKFKIKFQDGQIAFTTTESDLPREQRYAQNRDYQPYSFTPACNSGFSYHGGNSFNIGNSTQVHQHVSFNAEESEEKQKKKKPKAQDYAAVALIIGFLAGATAFTAQYVKGIYDDYSFRLQFKGDRFRIISNILISTLLGGLMGIATGLVVASFVPNIFIVAIGALLGGILSTGCSLIGFDWLTKNQKDDPLYHSKNLHEYLKSHGIGDFTTAEAITIQQFLVDIIQDIDSISPTGEVYASEQNIVLTKEKLIKLLKSLQNNNDYYNPDITKTLSDLIAINDRSLQHRILGSALSKIFVGSSLHKMSESRSTPHSPEFWNVPLQFSSTPSAPPLATAYPVHSTEDQHGSSLSSKSLY
jgi:hypothetical protein